MALYISDGNGNLTKIAGKSNINFVEDSIATANPSPLADYYNKPQVDAKFTSPTLTSSSATYAGKAGTKYVGSHICIESWKATDGTKWYRKYSDGWKECGGHYTGTGNVDIVTESMPITFSSTNYTVYGACVNSAESNFTSSATNVTARYILAYGGAIATKTTSSFKHSTIQDFDWYACGY